MPGEWQVLDVIGETPVVLVKTDVAVVARRSSNSAAIRPISMGGRPAVGIVVEVFLDAARAPRF